jgi:peptidoglycan glycosyltransferase
LLRATTGLYPPGSTFKVMMAAAAIEEGLAQPDTVYEDSGALEIEGRVMVEPNRPDERRTDWTLTDGLAYSLNVLYAQVGLQLGADSLRALAERFGIGRALPFTLPVAEGQVASSGEFLSRRTAVADTAIGQGELLVTPLHMAVATSAIAAGGRLPRPTLVGRIDGDSAGPGPRAAPESLGQAVSPQTASAVRQMMIESAAYGYASAAQIPGYAVGAKTGTAESGQEAPHSWFVAFAEAGKRTHVVSVCIEHGGEGGGIALQVGRRLLEASLVRD